MTQNFERTTEFFVLPVREILFCVVELAFWPRLRAVVSPDRVRVADESGVVCAVEMTLLPVPF